MPQQPAAQDVRHGFFAARADVSAFDCYGQQAYVAYVMGSHAALQFLLNR